METRDTSRTSGGHVTFGAVALAAAAAAAGQLEILRGRRALLDDDVHSTRVLLKKLRAVIHLGRGTIRKRERRAWNDRLRQASTCLANARDGVVLRETLDMAAAGCGISPDAPELAAMQANLGKRYPRRLRPGARQLVLETLEAVVSEWPGHWGEIAVHPRKAHRRMREAAAEDAEEARADGHPGAWHSWRRRVKYVAYQLEWMSLAGNGSRKRTYRKWRRLGSILGKLNDLHNLLDWLDSTTPATPTTRQLAEWCRRQARSKAGEAISVAGTRGM